MQKTAIPSVHQRVAAHYARVAPLLVKSFGSIPFVYASFPEGLGTQPHWHHPVPLSEPEIAHVVRYARAIELHSWTPVESDPRRARFGRILLELDKEEDREALHRAAPAIRDLLRESLNLEAIPLLSGNNGIALYVPLAGAPSYAPLREAFNELCREAVRRDPATFATEPNSHGGGRVHLHASSNAQGRYSALPYSLRGDPYLHVCAPVTWDELATLALDAFTAERFEERLDSAGDLFAERVAAIGEQRLPEQPRTAPAHARDVEPHGHVLRAAQRILEDGRPRDAGEILAEAVARGLLVASIKDPNGSIVGLRQFPKG